MVAYTKGPEKKLEHQYDNSTRLPRVCTINLGKAWITPEHKRTDRVVNMIREFAEKHMKSNEIKLDQDLKLTSNSVRISRKDLSERGDIMSSTAKEVPPPGDP